MSNSKWSLDSKTSQLGKSAIITGANSGLGFETMSALIAREYQVVMACRDQKKIRKATAKIKATYPHAQISAIEMDLADMKSVRAFAKVYKNQFGKLDLLINNAGIMMPPYGKTKDGFESQMGVNYFGHFLLTGLLMDVLNKANSARVVTLSSIAHRWGDIYFEDMAFDKGYNKRKAYGQSKLACLMFAYELDARCRAYGLNIKSFAAHPGVANTELIRHMPGWVKFLSPIFLPLISQNARLGAQLTIHAALDETLSGGSFIGPEGLYQLQGRPTMVQSNQNSHDLDKRKKLWSVSEKMTGLEYL